MVDTAVRPRPDFSTFLVSDQNAGGDGLSFYNYKKIIRSQKVALLQQRRSVAHVPGYKPVLHEVLQQQEETAPRVTDAETQTTQYNMANTDHGRSDNIGTYSFISRVVN